MPATRSHSTRPPRGGGRFDGSVAVRSPVERSSLMAPIYHRGSGTGMSRAGASRAELIEGGIVGLLVGDALGVPYEFHGPDSIPAVQQIEMAPPENYDRAHPGTPPGTWSDDGAQALALLASLLDRGRL